MPLHCVDWDEFLCVIMTHSEHSLFLSLRLGDRWDTVWWGDVRSHRWPWVSVKHKHGCINKCWNAEWDDLLPVWSNIMAVCGPTVDFTLLKPVWSPPCPEQKWCRVNDGVVLKKKEWWCSMESGENCGLNFCSPSAKGCHITLPHQAASQLSPGLIDLGR